MVRWLRWHCPPDTGFEIRALAVWGRVRYLSVTEAPHNFCFFETAETGNRTPDSGVKGSGANHYPRAPARKPWRPEFFFSSLNHHNCLSLLFLIHLNTYVMGLPPLEVFLLLQCEGWLWTSKSDVYRRHILTTKVDLRALTVNYYM